MASTEGGDDPEVFDLLPPTPPATQVRSRHAAVSAASVPAADPALGPAGVAPVLNYDRAAPAEAMHVAQAFPEIASPWRDIYVPAALVVTAFGVIFVASYSSDIGILVTLLAVSAFAVTKAVVMVFAVPAMTRFADVSFGRISPALLKLAAIGLLPDAAAASVFRWTSACSGVLLSIPAAVATGWLLLRFLFDFDFAESMWCTVVLTVMTLVPYLLWYQLYWKVIDVAG
jgi:hypothetical protein